MTDEQLKHIERDLAEIEASGAVVWPVQVESLHTLIDTVRRYRTALEVYADEGNWRESSEEWGWEDWWMPTKQHGYDIARKALEGGEE